MKVYCRSGIYGLRLTMFDGLNTTGWVSRRTAIRCDETISGRSMRSSFRFLSNTPGRNPQHSKLSAPLNSKTSSDAFADFAAIAFLQWSDIESIESDAASVGPPNIATQQNRKTNPLNHTAINPACVLWAIVFSGKATINDYAKFSTIYSRCSTDSDARCVGRLNTHYPMTSEAIKPNNPPPKTIQRTSIFRRKRAMNAATVTMAANQLTPK